MLTIAAATAIIVGLIAMLSPYFGSKSKWNCTLCPKSGKQNAMQSISVGLAASSPG